MILKGRVCTSRVPRGFFLVDSHQAAHFPLELVGRASSPSLVPPRTGRSLLTLNMRRIVGQPAPHLQLATTTEEIEPASIIPFSPHSPFTPMSVSPLYSSPLITRPRLTWSEERALRESLETAFTGRVLRAQSFVEDAPLPRDVPARRSGNPSASRLEVEEHARGRRWQNEGRREDAGRGRPRRGSTASARGRGTAMKGLGAADSSRRRERN